MSDAIYDATTMWELVERRAAASPDRTMLLDPNGPSVTFGEFRTKCEAVAAALAAKGVSEGTPVSWQLPTSVDAIVLCLALARLGAVQNPILHVYREREVTFALNQLQPKLFFVPSNWRGFDFEGFAKGVCATLDTPPEIVVVDGGLPTGDPADLPAAPTVAPGAEAPVRWIYYTSGTTAEPKGVRHTDQTLLAGGKGLALALEMGPSDVGSIAFPFTHIAGPDYLVTMLANGFPAILIEAFVPADAVEILNRFGGTLAGGSTAFYLAYLNEQRKDPSTKLIPTLRLLAGGGAPKPPEVFYEVQREMGIPVAHGYGMTEVPMIAQGSPDDSEDALANSDGKPVFGAEIKIVGLDGKVATEPGVDGEIRVRGPMVCKGYTNPALDAEAFDEEGFFRTGDLGHIRADGHIALTGRLKDVIIRKGENVSAREVEDVLYRHAKVGDVAVIGLPDRERGERVCAAVETAAGQDALTLEELVAHCKDAGLMTQKIPEQLVVMDELPRNKTLNKILKQQLRDDLAKHPWP